MEGWRERERGWEGRERGRDGRMKGGEESGSRQTGRQAVRKEETQRGGGRRWNGGWKERGREGE